MPIYGNVDALAAATTSSGALSAAPAPDAAAAGAAAAGGEEAAAGAAGAAADGADAEGAAAAAALADAEARAAAAARVRRLEGLGEFAYFVVAPQVCACCVLARSGNAPAMLPLFLHRALPLLPPGPLPPPQTRSPLLSCRTAARPHPPPHLGQDIVVGRFRDAEDRVEWLLEARRFEDALALAERARGLPAAAWGAVVQAYLAHLTAAGEWAAAARLLPRLLRGSAPAWERWAAEFGAARRLPLLAPVLPTRRPALHPSTYEALLGALLADPAHHAQLLALVRSWPNSLYAPAALIDAVARRMQRPGGETRELWQVRGFY